jgi:hypothetical protein
VPKKKSGYSKKSSDWLGRPITEHFNSRGDKTGYSKKGTSIFGSARTERFNSKGEKTGYSKKSTNLFGTATREHYKSNGDKIGYSKDGRSLLGAPITERYNSKGEKIGQSKVGSTFFGTPIIEHYREEVKPSLTGSSSVYEGYSSVESVQGSKSSVAGGRAVFAIGTVVVLLIVFGVARRFVSVNTPELAPVSALHGSHSPGAIENIDGLRLQPIDEAPQDQSFLQFRNELISAISEKNSAFLLSVTSPTIKIGFGDNPNTVEEFARVWHLDSPDSPLWNDLGTTLGLGGTFTTKLGQKQFCAPYVSSAWPPGADSFSYVAVTARNVRLRAQAEPSAQILGNLSYNVIKLLDWNVDRSWAKVTTEGNETGYVSGKFVRSPIDYRAFFSQVDGKWILTAFVAGD